MVHEGNLVRANDTVPLVVINQVTPIYVSFAIPESRLPELKRYMAQGTLQVPASPPNEDGPPAVGQITLRRQQRRSDDRHDPDQGHVSRTPIAVCGRGSSSTSRSRSPTDPTAIVVPTAAIQVGQQGQYAFVVKADQTRSKAASWSVDADAAARRRWSKSGLKPGETVVTDGHLRLVAGSRVSIKGEEAPKVAP